MPMHELVGLIGHDYKHDTEESSPLKWNNSQTNNLLEDSRIVVNRVAVEF